MAGGGAGGAGPVAAVGSGWLGAAVASTVGCVALCNPSSCNAHNSWRATRVAASRPAVVLCRAERFSRHRGLGVCRDVAAGIDRGDVGRAEGSAALHPHYGPAERSWRFDHGVLGRAKEGWARFFARGWYPVRDGSWAGVVAGV
jgi:hypothetical protein